MARRRSKKTNRRGTLLTLAAFMLIALLATVACAIDLGYTVLIRTQLQATADAAALAAVADLPYPNNVRATANQYGVLNTPTNGPVITNGTIVLGLWDASNRTFTPSENAANAVQVTAKRTADNGNPVSLFFAPAIGISQANVTATSIGVARPRDIVFVLDLSGSMNDDAEPWATAGINAQFAAAGYPTVGTDLMQAVFDDFGFGSYPGVSQYVGNTNVVQSQLAFYELTRTGGYLSGAAIPVQYQILAADTAAVRKQKGYQWMIDNQLAVAMANALPTPNATNYAYWEQYLDYVIQPLTLSAAQRANYANYNGSIPVNQNSFTVDSNSNYAAMYNKLGYLTYVQFMMDYGRDRNVTGAIKTPLAATSPLCPFHTDIDPTSGGFGFSFPPREQATHAARVAVMAAIDNIALRNNGIGDALKDHVAIVTFDTAANTVVRYPLNTTTCDYNAVKGACPNLQAVQDSGSSTATENGLILAKNHLDPNLNPSGARTGADKVVVLLTDGAANIKASSNGTIDNYVSTYNATHNPDGEWYTSSNGSYRELNAAMMQVDIMKGRGFRTYSVGIGLDADKVFMDRMARLAGTGITDPNNPNGPKISPQADGNPANYQQRLISIFQDIILQGNGQLVR